MFIYLSKKIAIPNNTKLKCIGWNKDQGYIACGGDDGLLKVLKLEAGRDGKVKGLAAPSNLSMNQTLEGHNGQIQVVGWNESHQKLTSSDQYGLIIVWMLYKGSWYEEMINNRNKSVVKGMAWNSDGQKICIVYEDGAVIVGSVDGNRIWGKELKNVMLSGVCWSPDSRLLLFSMATGEIHIYDGMGSFVSKMNIQCLTNTSQTARIISLQWYDGKHGQIETDAPSLMVCYENGRVQIMKNETDENPVLLDTGLITVGCQWNHDGSILAIAGILSDIHSQEKEANVVQFYSPFGELLRTLKVPGKQISACAWEGGSLRIALAVDSFIYFANIRPDYKWAYFANTVVYTYSKPDRTEADITFWNTRSGEKNTRHVNRLNAISSSSEHCVLAITLGDDHDQSYSLTLCNSLGTTVDTKLISMEPSSVCMTPTTVFAASRDHFYVWYFRTAQTWTQVDSKPNRSANRKEQVYHVDDTPTGGVGMNGNQYSSKPTNDPICCLAASEKILLIGRESGLIQLYSLPSITLTNRYNVNTKPYKMAINSNSTTVSVIGVTGLLLFIKLDGSSSDSGLMKMERKDVWDMKWADDNPDLFAMMEKTRMYIFRNMEPEEPILSAGYICSFKDLEIRAALLDEILRDPENPIDDYILDLEVKSLRDTRDLLEKVGMKDAMAFIDENPHPRLWRLLAEAAIEQLDLTTAESAYVRCKDYPGIQFVKKLQNIQDAKIQKAEVAAWFSRYEDAEKIFLDVDRRDLAINLRKRLGDWFRVLQLVKTGSGGNDSEMEEAWNNIGEYFIERHNYDEAVQFFEKSRNVTRLVQCYHALEDFSSLENVMDDIQPNDPLLSKMGHMFAAVGMGKQAVEAFVKANNVPEAVNTCIHLNQWHEAVELATKFNQPTQISSLLAKYAQHLLDENKIIQAIELYRKANHFLEAARLLTDLAKEETLKRSNPLRIKKLYVLSAFMVDEHLGSLRRIDKDKKGHRSSALIGLMGDGTSLGQTMVVDEAWRGAEAFHFFMLCQRQLYEGFVDAAMKTALNLRDYEDVLNAEDIYSLLALASCANRAFGTCSKAFIKLESLEELTSEQREAYQELAMDIFIKQAPKDSRSNRSECASCETMIPDWLNSCPSCQTKFPICIVTGRPIMDLTSAWQCENCKHRAYEQDITMRQNCPLCHSPIAL